MELCHTWRGPSSASRFRRPSGEFIFTGQSFKTQIELANLSSESLKGIRSCYILSATARGESGNVERNGQLHAAPDFGEGELEVGKTRTESAPAPDKFPITGGAG